LIARAGNEFFDDALGMRPKAARMWSNITLHAAATLGFEAFYANVFADPAAATSDYDSSNASDVSLMDNPKGFDPLGGRFPGGDSKKAFDLSNIDISLKSLSSNYGETLAIVGKGNVQGAFKSLSLIPQHTGAIAKNFPGSGMKFLWPGWGRAIFGTCHQVTNATLLAGGLSNTVAGIFPHYSTWATTALYGNYGGQVGGYIYQGSKARDEY